VDLHCHVLPGLDDGARDLDDAIAMARQAQGDRIAVVCATPHIRHDHDVRIAELPERIAELSAALREDGVAVAIAAGGEVAVTALDGLDDAELRAVSLGASGRWILLEPAPGPLDDTLDAAVARLAARGFRAVVAHPERHLAADLVARLRRLVGRGAIVQATAAFLEDPATASGMRELARAGVIHVLGTDAHSSRAGRPVVLSPALLALSAVQPTAAHLRWIAHTAPEGVLRGEEVAAPF
jgi:protein-tyrosine phosphatase